VFEFSDAEVREAMVPRTAVDALPITATLELAKESFRNLGYSRLPVYGDDLDHIIGVLHRRDLEPYLEQAQAGEFSLKVLVRPPLFIPATAGLGTALKQMQAAKTHLAFATDEHGGVEGIITLEDLLEEIVGEISDEYDEEVRSQIVRDGSTYLLDGLLAVRDANRHLKLGLPEEGAYTTIAGFMMAQAGRLLRPGDVIEYDGAQFKVERVERRRIQRIRYTPAKSNEPSIAAFMPVCFYDLCVDPIQIISVTF
jgi:CBS domain containing-hemolysin-like protein